MNDVLPAIDPDNQDAYDDLLVSLEAGQGISSLLIAACDSPQLRQAIVQRYEAELAPNIHSFQVHLDLQDPSLHRALVQLVARSPLLQQGEPAIVTVLGIEQLFFLQLDPAEPSQQSTFLGYLQWTREALAAFHFPIVLWVTHQFMAALSQEAPDFWSWRKGVFRFVAKPNTFLVSELDDLRPAFAELGLPDGDEIQIPLTDLQALITQTEARRPNDPLLGTLYHQLGRIYAQRVKQGNAQDYPQEIELATNYFQKAVALREKLGEQESVASSLVWLGRLYQDQGRYSEAEPLYLQALEIYQSQLGQDHPSTATSLNNLAGLYESQGRYSEAEPLYLQALEIRRSQLGQDHPDTAMSLNNLAELYRSQGRYSEAEPLYLQALEIWRSQAGHDHSNTATSLNNLAALYDSQGRYSEAEPLYLQALEIWRSQLGQNHPDTATSLNNLALLYKSQGRYSEAEPLYLQALEIWRSQLGQNHPDTAFSLNNLAALYDSQGRYSEAEPLYVQALEILFPRLGESHPNMTIVFSNLYTCLQQSLEAGHGDRLSDHSLTQSLLQQLRTP
ncbi:MAG: tetratricopeptide repeat protein [Timaviella obliquedivisa GSE-PSE-MK23-08B]|jgi:tetratricopeptide (TPR) repeat protein|nr:tetratricopeptide repeat protein [Timaviella obliquedivisa GSE-PSE-MK23-08B]